MMHVHFLTTIVNTKIKVRLSSVCFAESCNSYYTARIIRIISFCTALSPFGDILSGSNSSIVAAVATFLVKLTAPLSPL